MQAYILDTETASLSGGVVELAYLVVDENLNVTREFCSLINPERPIEEGAFAIHGISDDAVKNMPPLSAFSAEVDNLIGHNCAFDLRMIKPHITAKRSLCTLSLARTYVTGVSNHKLETLQAELFLPEQKSHSALGDVHTTRDLLAYILQITGLSLETLFQRADLPKIIQKMPFGKHKGKPMLQVPRQYREWLLTEGNLDKDLKFTLEKLRNL